MEKAAERLSQKTLATLGYYHEFQNLRTRQSQHIIQNRQAYSTRQKK